MNTGFKEHGFFGSEEGLYSRCCTPRSHLPELTPFPLLHTPIDNIFSVKSWVKKSFNMDGSVFDQQFEIPSDLDYVEA